MVSAACDKKQGIDDCRPDLIWLWLHRATMTATKRNLKTGSVETSVLFFTMGVLLELSQSSLGFYRVELSFTFISQCLNFLLGKKVSVVLSPPENFRG